MSLLAVNFQSYKQFEAAVSSVLSTRRSQQQPLTNHAMMKLFTKMEQMAKMRLVASCLHNEVDGFIRAC